MVCISLTTPLLYSELPFFRFASVQTRFLLSLDSAALITRCTIFMIIELLNGWSEKGNSRWPKIYTKHQRSLREIVAISDIISRRGRQCIIPDALIADYITMITARSDDLNKPSFLSNQRDSLFIDLNTSPLPTQSALPFSLHCVIFSSSSSSTSSSCS